MFGTRVAAGPRELNGVNGVNLLVFRETRQRFSTRHLRDDLLQNLDALAQSRNSILDALIRAGELECGLADCQWPHGNRMSAITDALADAFVHEEPKDSIAKLAQELAAQPLPDSIQTSPPEGFAYYALHPSDFAQLAARLDSGCQSAIVGIRSIGTVLSAVWAAALRHRGTRASRITVRPHGHPYDRQTSFTAEQTCWLQQQLATQSQFFIVDEGPGLSGSSLLSVGEALIEQGVPRERITMIGTRAPEPGSLCARDAANRWRQFRFEVACPAFYSRFSDCESLSGGAWRDAFLGEHEWPACWPQMARLKFRSADRKRILKFEGFGRFGERAREIAAAVSGAGFGPAVENAGDGLNVHEFIAGQPLKGSAVSREILETMARYCAFRKAECTVSYSSSGDLGEMTRFNISQELGIDVEAVEGDFQPRVPVLVDGRMQPHEWLITPQGTVFKVDNCTHGDDHFFPGPTDIAWDLAGAAVEWNLDRDAEAFLLRDYQRVSGDNVSRRISAFLLAYSAFRMAYCKMASVAVGDADEVLRLQHAYDFYRCRLTRGIASCKSDHAVSA